MAEVLLPPQQLGIDLGEFLQLRLQLAVMSDAGPGALLLDGGLEEELVDPADGQALGQVIKRAVWIAAVVAMAVGFATPGELLDQRGAQGIGGDFELREEEALALAQGQRGFGGVMNPSHKYGEDRRNAAKGNKKENEVRMRKCSPP